MTNNPKNRQQWIFDLLKVENLTFSDVFSKYYAKFSKSEVTFSKDWNKVSSQITEYRNKVDKAKEEQSIAIEVDALKSGLKTKLEWVGVLQKELDDNQVEESVLDLKTGKVIRYMRKMTPTERKGHMERISKFMGFEASIKQEVVVTDKTIAVKYTD